jgi:hypothetical protein
LYLGFCKGHSNNTIKYSKTQEPDTEEKYSETGRDNIENEDLLKIR